MRGVTVVLNCQQMIYEWLILTGKQMIKPPYLRRISTPLGRVGVVGLLALMAAVIKIVVSQTSR